MKPITIRCPYPISANDYWQVARGRVIQTADARRYIRECQLCAVLAGVRSPVSVPIALDVTLIPPAISHRLMKDGHGRAHMAQVKAGKPIDLSNCIKIAEDALQGVAYVNDRQTRAIMMRYGEPELLGALVVKISEFVIEPVGLFA